MKEQKTSAVHADDDNATKYDSWKTFARVTIAVVTHSSDGRVLHSEVKKHRNEWTNIQRTTQLQTRQNLE